MDNDDLLDLLTKDPFPPPSDKAKDQFLGMGDEDVSAFGPFPSDVSNVDFWLSDNVFDHKLPFVGLAQLNSPPGEATAATDSHIQKKSVQSPIESSCETTGTPNRYCASKKPGFIQHPALVVSGDRPSGSQPVSSPLPPTAAPASNIVTAGRESAGQEMVRSTSANGKRARKHRLDLHKVTPVIQKKSERSASKQAKAKQELSLAERRRIRAERNRESAEKSRIRRKQYTYDLEASVVALREEFSARKKNVERWHAHFSDLQKKLQNSGRDASARHLRECLTITQRTLLDVVKFQPVKPVTISLPSSAKSVRTLSNGS